MSIPTPSSLGAGKPARAVRYLFVIALSASEVPADTAAWHQANKDESARPIAPAVSTASGLLLEPALTLPEFTREKFLAAIDTIRPQNILKPWTTPVEPLPLHPRSQAVGLTHDEVMSYMTEVKDLFDTGHAISVADVGLISTQEHVVRQPMLNEISAFSNSDVRAYLLAQKTLESPTWAFFSIVEDLTVHPVRDYYAKLTERGPKFLGKSCYACHSSGPLAIHPLRADLVSDARLAAAINHDIANQHRSQFFFPRNAPKPPAGQPLTLPFCARCHSDDGRRAQLYQVHSHPIRVMVDFGYMPPDRHLTPEEIAELKEWLKHKP